jgi:hypothetical protein
MRANLRALRSPELPSLTTARLSSRSASRWHWTPEKGFLATVLLAACSCLHPDSVAVRLRWGCRHSVPPTFHLLITVEQILFPLEIALTVGLRIPAHVPVAGDQAGDCHLHERDCVRDVATCFSKHSRRRALPFFFRLSVNV